jgi:hypothetical protein
MENSTQKSPIQQLEAWKIQLEGQWTEDEIQRIHAIFQKLVLLTGDEGIEKLFNNEATIFHHSGRPGKVGRTLGPHIYLDNDWTDWTMAHELGHRWNNAWKREPERLLRKYLKAGRLEWLKNVLRRLEKWLSSIIQSLGGKQRFDWKALWYNPGGAPPPCGVDRNFNSSEDLAESFAASIFPDDAKLRANKAAKRLADITDDWDWGKNFEIFHATPRGKVTLQMIQNRLSPQQHSDQSNQRTA